jgi:hypothetical protein
VEDFIFIKGDSCMMKKHLLKLIVLSMLSLLISLPLHVEAKEGGDQSKQCINSSSVQLTSALQRLWIDHTIWTRSYIVSATDGLPDQSKVLERLLKNQDDIGNAVKPYYGEKAGGKLAELLREHILLAGKVVDAAKSNNQADLKKFNTEWYRNADDIAAFLSNANPNLGNKELKELLYVHLQMVTDQVIARLKKDWANEILAFDKGENHIVKLADALADGIIKQFPQKL